MTSASARPIDSIGYRLVMLRHAWARQAEAVLAPIGLTHMQFFMLRTIQHATASGGPLPSQTHLADFMSVDRMTVSTVVRTLEGRRLVLRETHPDDPRANSVRLTAEGCALVWRASQVVTAEQDRFFGRLGPDGLAQFDAMLTRLLDFACPSVAGPDVGTR